MKMDVNALEKVQERATKIPMSVRNMPYEMITALTAALIAAAVSARHVFFSNRVVPHWNKLPENVVKSKSTAKFKMALDKFNGIGCYSSSRPVGGDGLRQSTC
ncbi:hypothetical protein BpHYR1_033394 [Brachionus plicatilis]|uniref:Uncharacterized protein n=1 Tax=Brachionus plicatilis TaxID=10195 RepID=A0A3M7Q1T2_BRAPC|nr:hypothetical protein BpHYR1_033394 [Brachionus plicatilis]